MNKAIIFALEMQLAQFKYFSTKLLILLLFSHFAYLSAKQITIHEPDIAKTVSFNKDHLSHLNFSQSATRNENGIIPDFHILELEENVDFFEEIDDCAKYLVIPAAYKNKLSAVVNVLLSSVSHQHVSPKTPLGILYQVFRI